MQLIEISPFVRYANEVVVTKRKETTVCLDCRLIFITHGAGKIKIDDKVFDFSAGTLLFWQPKTAYRFVFKNTIKAIVIDFDLISNGENQKEIFSLVSPKSPDFAKINPKIHNFTDAHVLNSPIIIDKAFFIKDRIVKIVEEFKKQTPFSSTNTSAHLKLCLSKIADTVMTNRQDKEIAQKVEFIVEYIQKNYSSPLSNELLATLVGYHPYYLNRIFKQSTSYTLHQYILNLRLSVASELLLSTNYTISKIAEKTGFNNQISFINAFKKSYRITPTEFRNKTL